MRSNNILGYYFSLLIGHARANDLEFYTHFVHQVNISLESSALQIFVTYFIHMCLHNGQPITQLIRYNSIFLKNHPNSSVTFQCTYTT